MNKYRNIRCEYKGIKFDSKKERDYYLFLIQLKKEGKITDLQLQVRFTVADEIEFSKGIVFPKITYVADFTYIIDGEMVVIDVKGWKSGTSYDVFKLKRHLMFARYGIVVQEV